jgi:hypothetical protein
VQEQDQLYNLPEAFFLQIILQLYQQRWIILCVDTSALWKIIKEEDASLITKNWGNKFSRGFLHSEYFGAEWTAMPPLLVALSLGRSDITWFRPWSTIVTGNLVDNSKWKNSKSCSDDWQHWRFKPTFRHFGTHFAGDFRVSKSSWMIDTSRSR